MKLLKKKHLAKKRKPSPNHTIIEAKKKFCVWEKIMRILFVSINKVRTFVMYSKAVL